MNYMPSLLYAFWTVHAAYLQFLVRTSLTFCIYRTIGDEDHFMWLTGR